MKRTEPLEKLFGLNGRITRLEYLLFGLLPLILFFTLITFNYFWIFLLIMLPLLVWIVIATSIKRGRDSGLIATATLLLFFLTPITVFYFHTIFFDHFQYLFLSFVVYLLVAPSSKNKIKEMSSLESTFLKVITSLLVIVALIGLIIPSSPCGNGAETQRKLACTQMHSIHQGLKMFKLDNGTYPTTKEGLEALIKNPKQEKYPNYASMPYFKKYPTDSWRSKILYVQQRDEFILISYGTDKKEGGEDDAEDIIYPDCRN